MGSVAQPKAGERRASAGYLTARYLLTFGVLAALAYGNYLILAAQIETSRSIGAIYAESGGQRSLLQTSELLSQKLVASDPKERSRVRRQLLATVARLEDAHRALLRGKPGSDRLPPEVQALYDRPPYLLNRQMTQYLADVRALAEAPDRELNWGNPHFLRIDAAAMSGNMVETLGKVVAAYQARSDRRTGYLRWLAFWSFASTALVLLISGLCVFRPMVRRVQEDMAEAQRQLQRAERLAAIGQMVAGVAHECRNVLQQMQACRGLLTLKVNGDRETRSLLTDLEKAQERLRRLFDDLRDYAAPATLDFRPCDLRKVVEEAWTTAAGVGEKRDVALRLSASPADTHCRADSLRLEQIFRNLLENAVGASGDGAVVEVEFSETTLHHRPAVEAIVRDNGPGFSPEQLEHAFHPFYTTKARGSGLGLAICKRFVDAHCGEISLGNHRPHGAQISITLPKSPP